MNIDIVCGVDSKLNKVEKINIFDCLYKLKKTLEGLDFNVKDHILKRKSDYKKIKNCTVNLCDGDPEKFYSFYNSTKYFENNKILFTGNSSKCFESLQDRISWDNKWLKDYLPRRAYNVEELENLNFPVIVKHKTCHGSLYFPKKCIFEEVEDKLIECLKGDFYCEEFIQGPEISYGEVPNLFKGAIKLKMRASKFLDFESKWIKTIPREVYKISEEEQKYIDNISMLLKVKFNMLSYYRLDFRKDDDGKLNLIDINPNCSIHFNGGLTDICLMNRVGEYREMIKHITHSAFNLLK